MEQARELYRESVTAAPGVLLSLLGWARLEEVDRQFERAGELLDQAERLSPGAEAVAFGRAVLLGRTRRYEAAVSVLDGLACRRPDQSLNSAELLEKGRLLDKMERYDEAFAAFAAGKRLAAEATGEVYRAQHAAQLAARLRAFFTPSRSRLLPRAGLREGLPQPIFILGFPRSGTTLVEQTLSVHFAIAAGDELPLVPEIANMLPRMFDSPLHYPEALADLWMADHREGLDNLRDYYLQKARQLGASRAGVPWFTDKMPLNEMHLGLIGLMFSRAPMIHVVRHPLDVVLSVFSNTLSHGFYCASDLDSVARHYALIMDLVDRTRDAVAPTHLRVRYESVIDDQRGSVERMLGFIGVEFEAACLRFEDNRRFARTAGYAQVTEPLHGRSTFRYQHYLRHLAPVIPILDRRWTASATRSETSRHALK